MPGQYGFANAVPLEETDNSALSNVLRFLSRPGFAVRSLISGEFGDAAENLGQMLLDLPTGGFLNRNLSLANAFSDTGDITDKSERPEFTDVLQRWGADSPASRGYWANLALDIGGGVLTDPLTLLTGPSRGVAQGALTGLGRGAAISTVKSAFTPKGLAAVEDMARAITAERAASRVVPSVVDDVVRGAPPLPPPRAPLPARGAEETVARAAEVERLTIPRIDPAGESLLFRRGLGTSDVAREADAAFPRVLRKKGMTSSDVSSQGAQIRSQADALHARLAGRADLFDAAPAARPRTPPAPPPRAPLPERLTPEDEAVERLFFGRAGRGFSETTPELDRAVRGLREFEDVMASPASMADAAPKFRAAIEQVAQARTAMSVDLDAGIARLRQSGMIGPGTGVRWAGIELPNAWSHIGNYATLPGIARMGLSASPRTKPIVEAAEGAVEGLWDWLRGNIYDKTLAGGKKIYEGLRYDAQRLGANNVAADKVAERLGIEWFGAAPAASRKAFGEILSRHEDAYRKALNVARAATPEELAANAGGAIPPAAAPEVARTDPFAEAIRVKGPAPSIARLKLPDPEAALAAFKAEVTQLPGIAEQSVDGLLGAFASQRTDLIKRGIWEDFAKNVPENFSKAEWEKIANSPFYIPHRLAPLFQEMLSESFKNKKLREGVLDVFTQARKHETAEGFHEALKAIAAEHNINVEGLADLQEFDIARLWRSRAFAHNRTIARWDLTDKARRLGMTEGDALSDYLKAQFAPTSRDQINPVPLRKLSEVIGGGKWRIDASNSPKLLEWGQRGKTNPDDVFFSRTVKNSPDGRKLVEVDWPGFAYVFKPLLTTAGSVGHHVRNTLSAVVMAGMDEEIGWQAGGRAVKSIGYSLMNLPLVRQFTKAGYAHDEIGDVVALLSHEPAERAAALGRLNAAGKKVGKYSWDEVAKILDGAIPERVNMADLDRAVGNIDAFGRELVGSWTAAIQNKQGALALKRAFQTWVKFGQDAANAVETRFRASAMLELLAKGKDPVTAMKQVEKAFVGYSVNSTTERFLRDMVPFLRFSIGSTAWLKGIANRPRLVGWMGRTQGSAENSVGDQGAMPIRAMESLNLPLPWRTPAGNLEVLTSMGLPQEVALQMLGAVSSPSGFRRQILGGMAPPIRLPLEAATNRSFFFGEEFAQYRKAPAWWPDAFTQEVELPNGKTRREVSGVANELINAMPTSKLEGQLTKILDPNTSWGSALLYSLTGARTIEVDARRELGNRLAEFLKEKARTGEVGSSMIYFARTGEGQPVPPEIQAALAGWQEIKQERRRGLAR